MIPQYVFIAPHADDELLSMGAAIVQHVQVHGPDRVAVVLASTGESSGARRALRDAGYVLADRGSDARDGHEGQRRRVSRPGRE